MRLSARWPSVEKWSLTAAAAVLAGCATSGWHAGRIDASSAAALERSVSSLRSELPSRRREDFDTSLAVIFMRVAAVNGGDVDGDGDSESFDARALIDAANDLLVKIRRGELVPALEEHDGDVTADYFAQLHGLRFDGVIALAELDSAAPYLAELHRTRTCNEVFKTRRAMLPPPSTPVTRSCTQAQLRRD